MNLNDTNGRSIETCLGNFSIQLFFVILEIVKKCKIAIFFRDSRNMFF